MSDISDWKILSDLTQEFVSNIKYVYIFDTTDNQVFILTKDDYVYAFGSNTSGCLGLGHTNQVTEPQLIQELRGHQVLKLEFNSKLYNVLALTKNGNVYSWGNNQFGQLGNGNQEDSYTPIAVEELIGKIVVDIRCSSSHCLALLQYGKVYAWGNNNCGQIGIGMDPSIQLIPIKINVLNKHNIVKIECGSCHSMVLTDKGFVYCWGNNSYGQLGNGSKNQSSVPQKLKLEKNDLIIKISCGQHHSLLLSKSGDVYAFGHNNYGQIGDETNVDRDIPIKLSVNSKHRFTQIASLKESNISVAKSRTGYCYVWGECIDQTITNPMQTIYITVNEVFAHYLKLNVTHTSICLDKNSSKPVNSVVSQRLLKSFDDQKLSDVTFKIDDKYIFAQKLHLISVCKYFEKLFQSYNTGDKIVIEITEYSYSVYYAFLKYLYYGCVQDIQINEIFELLNLAQNYKEEELRQECVELIESNVTSDNVSVIHTKAYNSNELQNYCLDFAAKNIDKVYDSDTFKQTQNIEFVKKLLGLLLIKK